MKLGGVVLAAGASRRMGSPKALLEVAGETLVDRQIRLLAACCQTVVVVVGRHGEEIRRRARRGGEAVFVDNPAPERGMLSSLQCGLAALPGGIDGWLFTPVDLPKVQEETVRALAAAARAGSFVIPRYRGRRGHPVLVGNQWRDEFTRAGEEETPRAVIDRHRTHVVHIDVDDPGVVLDVDTPEDFRAVVT